MACFLVQGERVKYYGKYCQCNDFNCDRSDNLPCGGRKYLLKGLLGDILHVVNLYHARGAFYVKLL